MTASKLHALGFVTGALLAFAVAQAQQPAQSSSAAGTAPASASQAQKTSSDSKATAQAADAAAAQKAAEAKLINDARNAGFKPETIRGAQMFCRTAVELGSNFPVRTCYDSDQVKIKIQEYAEQRNQLEQMHNTGMQTH